jgi:site-specific recombinase XerC
MSTPQSNLELATIQSMAQVSAVSSEAAIAQPMAAVVDNTIKAAARNNPNTARAYQTAIGLFLSFLDAHRGHLVPEKLADAWRPFAMYQREGRRTIWIFRAPAVILRLVDSGVLDNFAAWRGQEGDGTNSIALRLYAIRTFLSVAYRDNILTAEQASAMRIQPYRARQKRDQKPVGRRLAPPEVRNLRESIDFNTRKGLRDRAIIDCMLFLGLRREEVVGLTTTNFKQSNGRWWLTLIGKGSKTRRLKVHETVFESLSEWFKVAGLDWHQPNEPLFRSVNKADRVTGRPINASVVGRLVAEYGYKSNLAPRFGSNQLSAHDLRRTCARNAFDNSGNLLLVQAMLGHSDPKTTARYIGAFEDDNNTAIDYIRY